MKAPLLRGVVLAGITLLGASLFGETVALSDLDLQHLHFEGWKKPRKDQSVSGKPLSIAGQTYGHGLGTCATTTVWLELDGKVERFQALIGIDDSAPSPDASFVFTVYGDGRELWSSPTLKRGERAVPVDVPLSGVRFLLLKADHVGAVRTAELHTSPRDFVDWIEPRFVTAAAAPRTIAAPPEEPVILTPKPPQAPQINGPTAYGCRPGHPFLYRIPTTGERPITFSADKLPPSLRLDADRGIITGSAPARGTYAVTLHARNRHGSAARTFTLKSGDVLALTPPMGWNHWYVHYRRITDDTMRAAADAMVKSGMADVGYAYVNIDDCWSNMPADGAKKDPSRVGPLRDAAGNIVPNRFFPDMPALTAYIHAYGLKAGIYSSPGPLTCAGFAGSYEHEEQDARQFAAWGFDFLKYDWCSYSRVGFGDTLEGLQKPYRKMGAILTELPRDVVFNLCQYGRGDVSEWGAAVGGQSWRTADDLGGELNRLFEVALRNAEFRRWSRPGAWNDPDYIQIGYIGDAHTGGMPRPCPLTPTEQYSFMSLWSLMAAPLFYSGDMDHLDAFTLNVLCNPEVIAIDQDERGDSARVVARTANTFVMVKELQDGGKAVGLCNRGEIATEVSVSWADLGVVPTAKLRDPWRQKDLGPAGQSYRTIVPRHGVVLFRVSP